MNNILKWIAVTMVVFVVMSSSFDKVYAAVYPWNALVGALSSFTLIYVALKDREIPYVMLNTVVAVIYTVGFIGEFT